MFAIRFIPGLFRRSFRAKEFRAHILVDPNDARSILRESLTVSEPIKPAGPVTMIVRMMSISARSKSNRRTGFPACEAGGGLACRILKRQAGRPSLPQPGWLCYYPPIIHDRSPAEGFAREAGKLRSH